MIQISDLFGIQMMSDLIQKSPFVNNFNANDIPNLLIPTVKSFP